MVERPGEKHRDRSYGLAVGLGTHVGGEGHFTHVEFQTSNHAPHSGHDRIDLDKLDSIISRGELSHPSMAA